MIHLNINTDEVVKYTLKLEKLTKSALPVAIRGSLNDAAFDVKLNTMPAKAESVFINRTKNFFRANSKVESATGFNINTMKSEVGFYENRLADQATNFAVKDLERQEHAGKIEGKTFIPTPFARSGGTKRGLVKPNLRLKKIRAKGIVDVSKLVGFSQKSKFQFASHSAGVGGFVLYKNILWQINSLRKKANISRTPIYSVKKNRSVKVKQTNFMKSASLQSAKKIEEFYIKRAKVQIEKLSR